MSIFDPAPLLDSGASVEPSNGISYGAANTRLTGCGTGPWRLAETNAGPASVVIDEFDAGGFPGPPNGQVIGRRH